MIHRDVVERFNRNASGILTPDEQNRIMTPVANHTYSAPGVDIVRVQHRLGEDGSGGGFKIIEGVATPDRLRAIAEQAGGLAAAMTIKGAVLDGLLNLPEAKGNDFGGAKGVGLVAPGTLDSRERLEAMLEGYVRHQSDKGALGLGIDRHAPDMNTGDLEMDLMARILAEHTGDPSAIAAFSGKSLEAGGLPGRDIATGWGLAIIFRRHLEALGRDPRNTTVAVQGSGNVGEHFARFAEGFGANILGMSDSYHAVAANGSGPLRIGGEDPTITFANRGIARWDEDHYKTLEKPDDLLEMDVDVLVFAGPVDTVTAERGNIKKPRAKILMKGANNPLDTEAIDYHLNEGRSIVADTLGNGAGFAASNIEYNQGISGSQWTEPEIKAKLEIVLNEAYDRVYKEGGEDPMDMVNPAFRVSAQSLAKRMRR